uniref:Uncharacterized protein n=1 Tax=Anguilla anguilla TaxID=7936 RepID=A0A0E9V6B9_ANGAN
MRHGFFLFLILTRSICLNPILGPLILCISKPLTTICVSNTA